MGRIVQTVVTSVLLVLFLWQTLESVTKFMKGQTLISTSYQVHSWKSDLFHQFYNFSHLKDHGTILFPSVTVCKKYIFDVYQSGDGINMEGDLLMRYLHHHTWNRSNLFYFMTHAKMLEKSFPCTTLEGGTDPGKPCSFPYIYYENMTSTECEQDYCFTRTEANLSVYYEGQSDFWSYCDPRCRGEKPGPTSQYNMAGGDDRQVWRSVLLDLRTYEPGLCHTYQPPLTSGPGTENGLYFLLGHLDNILEDSSATYMMYSFNIFLHHKVGQL